MRVASLCFLLLCFFLLVNRSCTAEESSTVQFMLKALLGGTISHSRPAETELKVIGAAYGRTGTKSLKSALDILGFHTYHMVEVKTHNHEKLIKEAFHEDKESFRAWVDDILKHGFTATVDCPTSNMYKQQLELFPNAKVILTERDPEKWFKSITQLTSMLVLTRSLPLRWVIFMPELVSNSLGSKKSPYNMRKHATLFGIDYVSHELFR